MLSVFGEALGPFALAEAPLPWRCTNEAPEDGREIRLGLETDAERDIDEGVFRFRQQRLGVVDPPAEDVFMRPQVGRGAKLGGEIHPTQTSGGRQIGQGDRLADMRIDVGGDPLQSPRGQCRTRRVRRRALRDPRPPAPFRNERATARKRCAPRTPPKVDTCLYGSVAGKIVVHKFMFGGSDDHGDKEKNGGLIVNRFSSYEPVYCLSYRGRFAGGDYIRHRHADIAR